MAQLFSVMTQSNAAPMELNLARILRTSLRQTGGGQLAGLPSTLILQDTKTRLKLRLVVNPKTGITISRARKTETRWLRAFLTPLAASRQNLSSAAHGENPC